MSKTGDYAEKIVACTASEGKLPSLEDAKKPQGSQTCANRKGFTKFVSERSTSKRNEKLDSAAGSTNNSVNDDLIRLVKEAERNCLTTKNRACSDLTDTTKLLSGDRPEPLMSQDNSQSLGISQKHSA